MPPAQASSPALLSPRGQQRPSPHVATQPDSVAVELIVINPTVRRNYQAAYERYVAEGHRQVALD
ncbi:MAG: hypothetical protein HY803_00120 [candidate division NC10 bacterium]|nr:hypothetical protein [candidate division NC10 bacterium]